MKEEQIAENIRKMRLKRKLTLERFSELTGLTKSYLSKLERSKKAPPFSTLNRIAVAMGIDISDLLEIKPVEAEDVPFVLVRKGERQIVKRGALYGYQYETLAHKKLRKAMEPYVIKAPFDEEAVFQHEGEEFIFVLEGQHEFAYGDEKYTLNKGDAIYFDSSIPHTGRSIGKKKSKLLAVIHMTK